MDRIEALTQRRRALTRLVDRVHADAASFHGLVRVGDVISIAEVCAIGPEALASAFVELEGRPHTAFPYDLTHAPPLGAFAHHPVDEVPPPVRDGLWARHGICDGIGATLVHDGRLLGLVFLYRVQPSAPFGPVEVATANSQLRWLRGQLQEARPGDAAHGSLEGTWVFDLEGHLLYGPEGVSTPGAQALGQHAKAWSRGHVRSGGLVAAHTVHVTHVEGPGGRALAAVVAPAHAVRPSAALALTPLKRRIATFAAHGATVPEIAASLGRSPETVRTHLKKIYEQLGVSSRVELAACCRTAWT